MAKARGTGGKAASAPGSIRSMLSRPVQVTPAAAAAPVARPARSSRVQGDASAGSRHPERNLGKFLHKSKG
jgi:hypothetical protein